MQAGGYEIDVIVSGFPGKAVCHGGLGWSTIALLRGHGRVALIDVGTFGMRDLLLQGLARRGLSPEDVTDVLLTHSHHDHSINWTLFAHARILIGATELAWSVQEPWGRTPVPELYMEKLQTWQTLATLADGETALPGITAHLAPGHTPGCLVFLLQGEQHDVVFTGDAAKNRAEMVSGQTDMTYDAQVSAASIDGIRAMWRRRPGSILIPGHDLPMLCDEGGVRYIGRREAAIKAWYGDNMETTTLIDLTVAGGPALSKTGLVSKTALVVSAHSADFVWRAGGAIALHAEAGMAVTVICLSFGERGESAKLWRQEGMTLGRVKAERQKEAEAAAACLGVADLQFWNLGDYPIALGQEALFRLVDVYRRVQPAFVLSHSKVDLYNHDHPAVTDFAQHARIIAQAHGHEPGQPVLGAPPVFLFEPHQPEQCDWKPDVLLDIGAVWEKKRAAIECMAGQEHLWEYYTRVALQRGAQAARNSDKPVRYGEGYEAVFPHVVERLA